MGDPRDANNFGRVVDNVYHSPGTNANAPLIFMAFEFLASHRPRSVCERQNFAIYAGEQRIIERIQFPLRRLLDWKSVFSHERGCASGG